MSANWETENAEARADFLKDGVSAADRIMAAAGWDACIAWVKRTALLKILGGSMTSVEVVPPRSRGAHDDQ